ncbi:hypothetical protein GU90_09175 [Saccharopolyspora rectivirgula]|jgi:DNA-binding protein YbaB|uniref:Uncharacterized protein n=1 Tax=Saccharopolyspora rectivirgula TaxID=28042 RepID=A0A073AYE3_9PSEU|nr:hypothetical protein GU90_09175 [Saccharopolyspora rectivirgula]
MHPDDLIAQYNSKLQQLKEDVDQAQAKLAEVGATATSRDGQITVRVNSSGVLEDISFGHGFRHPQPERLAASIMETVRQAQREAAGQMVSIMQEFVGEGSALEFVKSNLPHGYAGDGTDEDEPPTTIRENDSDDEDDDYDDGTERSFLR